MKRRAFLGTGVAGACGVASAFVSTSALASSPSTGYLRKMAEFDRDHPNDVYLTPDELALLRSLAGRLRRVQRVVGHGRFHTLGFDTMRQVGRNYSKVGRFTPREVDLIEAIFEDDVSRYGFYGRRVIDRLTVEIPRKETLRIPGGGQRIFRGAPERLYRRMSRAVGPDMELTSGIRGLVKQAYLFVNKVDAVNGNLSRASRSLAPPGYSYHGIGDFDIGKRGLGAMNFTYRFAETDVYEHLANLGFVRERYPEGNLLGVRYEPWHIKVA